MQQKMRRILACGMACILGIIGGSMRPQAAYEAPAMEMAAFHEGAAEGNDSVKIDLSQTSQGIVAATAKAAGKVKFQVILGEAAYTYDLSSEGAPGVFPLQSGNGHYSFRVLENVSGSKYAMLYQTEADVQIEDEFAPFLRPSVYTNYSAASACVTKARELAATAEDANGVVHAVFDFICSNVVYDREKAATVQAGYVPKPDETLSTGKGICFDYAALAAAMLRSQGIPTKMIFGYVSPNDVYHAWNMFYTEDTGWVTVDYQVSEDSWNRLDLTFSANGADGSFIGDGSNYTDVYYY